MPADANAIIKEGAVQDHCVGGLAGAHSYGKTTIIFIRKRSEHDVPFFTLELKNDFEIKQCYGKGNKVSYTKNLEVGQFLEHYIRHLKYCSKKGSKTL